MTASEIVKDDEQLSSMTSNLAQLKAKYERCCRRMEHACRPLSNRRRAVDPRAVASLVRGDVPASASATALADDDDAPRENVEKLAEEQRITSAAMLRQEELIQKRRRELSDIACKGLHPAAKNACADFIRSAKAMYAAQRVLNEVHEELRGAGLQIVPPMDDLRFSDGTFNFDDHSSPISYFVRQAQRAGYVR